MRRAAVCTCACACILGIASAPSDALAHAFGRIGVDHYIIVTPQPRVLQVDYDLHIGEDPTAAIRSRLDANQNGLLDRDEMMEYVRKSAIVRSAGLRVRIRSGSTRYKVKLFLPPGGSESNCVARVIEGEDGDRTLRIRWSFQAPWPEDVLAMPASPVQVSVTRPVSLAIATAGWVFVAGSPSPPVAIDSSNVPTEQELPPLPDVLPEEEQDPEPFIMAGATLVCRLDPDAPAPDPTDPPAEPREDGKAEEARQSVKKAVLTLAVLALLAFVGLPWLAALRGKR